MDALAHARYAAGLPALSINWGSWSEVGMAAGVSADHQRRWDAMGFQLISPDAGMRMLGTMMYGVSAPQVVAFPLVRSRLPASLGPLFSELTASRQTPAGDADANILKRLNEAPQSERLQVLTTFLSGQVSQVLAFGPSATVDPRSSLIEMGMDSLMAMELANRLKAALGVKISAGDLLQGTSVADLALVVLDAPVAGDGVTGPSPAGAGAGAGAGAAASADSWEEGSL
jgi:myxalamid-type polyketide synthase MxaB